MKSTQTHSEFHPKPLQMRTKPLKSTQAPLGKVAAVEACPARAFPLLLRRCTRPASRFHLAATAAVVMAQRRRGGSGAAAAFEK
uniref:Uncharacterized protein n=1 Tax=Oryza nivara TaxID=4536 RepID=A0A0E0I8E3_ORYNI